MITLLDIKTAVNTAIKPTGLKTYGNEVKEGFSRPCFFVNVTPVKSETFKKDTSENSVMVEIVYFSQNRTDLENLQMYDTLKGLLTPVLAIGAKKKMISNFRGEVIDEIDRIYSVKFDLNYYDGITDATPEAESATTLNLNLGGQQYGIT
ncbi:hypothetical protein DEAC_c40130 [Desulfosporosinus acididurans]|uniref:Uncharacterized protein n=1 Tax=Desulfosporosinus acididurans TaxID=476652 RepID=A0A0J1FKM5_9FIRM|nr:hypothetical protein [Desulfosporosinus acididurans]KLU64019.1 hypothetical protein DEAC_c40130 [Desulfosporosinus acididurans]